jgi:hypothetical protein
MSFKKTTIALIYDFDNTLSTKDMQEYAFIPAVGMKPEDFWFECSSFAKENRVDLILAYMYVMLKKAKETNVSLKKANFKQQGESVELYKGLDTWFDRITDYGNRMNLKVEHYIISSGLKEIIEGTAIKSKFKEIFASEFYYDIDQVAQWPANAVNYTSKTQFLFRINKGALDMTDHNTINEYIEEDKRKIPFSNMIYIGDGLTDVPCMKLVKANGGHSIAVYKPRHLKKVQKLLLHKRVDFLSLADYSEASEIEKITKTIIDKIAVNCKLNHIHKRQMDSIKQC